MDSDTDYFYQFNSELITNLKKLVYDEYLKNQGYNYMVSNSTITLDSIFTKYKEVIYKDKDDNESKLEGYLLTASTMDFSDDIKASNLKMELTPAYRVMYKSDNSYIDYFTFSSKEYDEPTREISSKLYFDKWATLLPSAMLNVCQKQLNNPFYYNLLGYKSQSQSKYHEFTAPIKSFDAAGDLSAVVVCSLRLVNSYYTGYCCQIENDNLKDKDGMNKKIKISFNQNTSMISYQEIEQAISLSTDGWRITEFYNQMEQDKGNNPSVYFTTNYDNGPDLKSYCTEQNIKIYYLEWRKDSFMTLKNVISTDNVDNPYYTVCTNIGKKPIEFTKDCVEGFDNLNNIVELVKSAEITVLKNDNDFFVSKYDYFKKGTFSNFDDNFHTLSMSSPSVDIRFSEDSYKQKTASLSGLDTIDGHNPHGNFSWLSESNNTSKNWSPLIMSEMIIFLTDGVNVDSEVLDNISKDNYAIWKDSFQLQNHDLRCNNTVPISCELDRKNPICACYPSYIDNTSNDINRMVSNMDQTALANSDRWCLNPACANYMAYKNPLTKGSSTCSSMCLAALYANTQNHSNLNIDNTQVLSLCDNQSSRDVNTSPCKEECGNDGICTFDNSTQKWGCIPNTSCTLECDDNSQCVIYDGNKQKCVPILNSTQRCLGSSDCGSDEYCNTDAGICFPNTKSKVNVFIAITIFISVVIAGLVIFILYKKYKKLSVAFIDKKNIWVFLLIFVLAVVAVIIYYSVMGNESEPYGNSGLYKDLCKSNYDCSKQNSYCIGGQCACLTGYNEITCQLEPQEICTNLPYLPITATAGAFYYVTMINDTIYAFATHSNFKYNGHKWQEIRKIGGQVGFSPYRSFQQPETGNMLNSNMCSTYEKSVYVFVPMKTYLSDIINPESNQTNSFLLRYEDNSTDMDWSLVDVQTKKGSTIYNNLSIYNNVDENGYYNNIVTVIVDQKLYIFGGIYYNNNIPEDNSSIGIYDLQKKSMTIKTIPTQYYKLRFTSYAKAFESKDKNIYLVGVQNLASDKKKSIYKYKIGSDPVEFTKVGICPDSVYMSNMDDGGNKGGSACYYYESKKSEYITIIHYDQPTMGSGYDPSNPLKVIWKIELPNKIPEPDQVPVGKIYPIYKPTLADSVDKQLDLIQTLFPANPSTTSVINENINIPHVTCHFEMNDLLFLVTGNGDIMRCNNYKDDVVNKLNIVPCYGVALIESPLYNVKPCSLENHPQDRKEEGYTYSKYLCGYYKDPYLDIENNCYIDGFGSSCYGQCEPQGDSVVNKCGKGWNMDKSGDCNRWGDDKCAFFCELPKVKKNDFYCDKTNLKWTQCKKEGGCDGGKWVATGGSVSSSCEKGISDCSCYYKGSELSTYCKPPDN